MDDICNVMRKPGGKNADGMPNRGQQVSIIAQESLMLAAFLFHHRWQYTFDRQVTGVHEDTVHLLAGQKKPKDKYKDPDVLPKINKSDMAKAIETTEEYIRSPQGVTRALLEYIIRKTIIVLTCGEYPKYATPGDKSNHQDVTSTTRQEQTFTGARCSVSQSMCRVQDRQ